MNQPAPDNQWRRCSSCKKPVNYGVRYWVCNVSTCNRKRTGLVFCTVSCWDAHCPMMNHRETWAEERTAPSKAQWAEMQAEEALPRKRKPREAAPEPVAPAVAPVSSAPKVLLRRKSSS